MREIRIEGEIFQFYISAIKAQPIDDAEAEEINFNSILVRLKPGKLDENVEGILKFQFYISAIKAVLAAVDEAVDQDFNSILVRLKLLMIVITPRKSLISILY